MRGVLPFRRRSTASGGKRCGHRRMCWRCVGSTDWAGAHGGSRPSWGVLGRRFRSGYVAAAGGSRDNVSGVARLRGLEEWLRDRLSRHGGNADVVRQELEALGVRVSLRTVQRAVGAVSSGVAGGGGGDDALRDAAGYQLQIDFGQRQVWIGGEKKRVTLFVATLGCSRRMHVRVFEESGSGTGSRGWRARSRRSGVLWRRCCWTTRERW